MKPIEIYGVKIIWYTMHLQLHIVCNKDLTYCLKISNELLPDIWHQKVFDQEKSTENKPTYRDMNDEERAKVALRLWEAAKAAIKLL